MGSIDPLPSQRWADSPMQLITTPQYLTKKTDLFTMGATHMALLHNSILRGYNSIYNQIPHIQEADKSEFIGYCSTWFKFVKTHHEDEEANLFTKIEELLQDKTVFVKTHKEHENFSAELAEFNTYLSTLPSPSALSLGELRRIMDSFHQSFESHFHNEIYTIAALARHPNTPKEGSEAEARSKTIFKIWGKSTVTNAGMMDVAPFFLLNLDKTAEEGMWSDWPPMPAAITWGLTSFAGAWKSGQWKFASCDIAGQPRQLYALQFPAQDLELPAKEAMA